MTLEVSSSSLKETGFLLQDFTCEGADTSPHLSWTDVPSNTQSIAVVAEDVDADEGTFAHWLMWGILSDVQELAAGVSGSTDVPAGAVEGINAVRYGRLERPLSTTTDHRQFECVRRRQIDKRKLGGHLPPLRPQRVRSGHRGLHGLSRYQERCLGGYRRAHRRRWYGRDEVCVGHHYQTVDSFRSSHFARSEARYPAQRPGHHRLRRPVRHGRC